MNPTVQRYLPPALVFGAALYFGWPPSEPFDLGEEVVRANSVRWRPEDVAEPPVIKPAVDPFEKCWLPAMKWKSNRKPENWSLRRLRLVPHPKSFKPDCSWMASPRWEIDIGLC